MGTRPLTKFHASYKLKLMILGIDEVGRGPWAGPLVVGACVLHDNPREEWQEQLADSKQLTAKRREVLEPLILKEAAATGLGWVSAEELDRVGLSEALRLACRRAVKEVRTAKVPFSEIIIDGTINFLTNTSLGTYVTNIKKADALVKEVSAASIIAKVARDRYMIALAEKYPGYGFEKHVGYGTKAHKEALVTLGPCPEHRQSFRPIRDLQGEPPTRKIAKKKQQLTPTERGQRAEEFVAEWLVATGHEVIARNYKSQYYEIDIISLKDGKIYFTEVKYRRNNRCGSPLEAITPKKLEQMKFAAKAFLHYKKLDYEPQLAAATVDGEKFVFEDWFPLEAE